MRAMSDATAKLLEPVNLLPTDRLQLDLDNDLKHFRARVFGAEGNGMRHHPSNAAKATWVSRVPEKKQLDGNCLWQLAATDYTAEIVNACWPREQLLFADKKTQLKFESLLIETTLQDQIAEAYAHYKNDGTLPDECAELEIHPDPKLALKKHQLFPLWASLRSVGYNLFMEQGTGKTPVAIARIMNECKRNRAVGDDHMLKVLVVCPKNVRLNWQRELARFCTRPGKVEVIKGGFMDRTTMLIEQMIPEPDCEWSVSIMSYEGMVKTWETLEHFQWDLVILDEGHYIKWPLTARAQYSFKLRDIAKSRMVLTGTPICNSPLDIYSLFEFDAEGGSGFQNYKKFKDFYGVFVPTDGDGHSKLVAIQNKPFMQERLARTAFIVTQKEALPDLPELRYDVIEAEMTEEQARAYKALAEKMLLEIESEMENARNKTMTVQNILTKLLRLAQVCAGYVVWDEMVDPTSLEVVQSKSVEFFKENPKLDELVAQLKEKTSQQKTIVWSCFVPAIKQIAERLDQEGIKYVTFYGGTKDADRVTAEDSFNCDPSVRVCIANPAAGGTGLNLLGHPLHDESAACDTDCDHHIYYACNWSYVQRAQSEKRSHRMGTRKSVRISDLVIPETLDENIRVRVLEKKMMAMDIADIREILKTVITGLGKRGTDET